MQKPKYGSRKWLKAVAEMLGEQLLGIELRDDSESGNVMPPVQVTFVIPMSYDKAPAEVVQVSQLWGYRMFSHVVRGGKTRGAILFDFNDPRTFPKRRDVIRVARKFGLTYAPEGLLNKHPHASRLSPTLYGTGRKMRLAIRRVAWGVCAAAVCYFVAAMFLGWNDAVPLFVLLFSSIVIVATDEDDGKAIGVLVGLAALLMLVLHVVDLGPFFDAIGLR